MKKILLTALVVMLMTPLSAHAFDWSSLFSWLLFGSETVSSKTKTVSDYSSVASDIRKDAKSADEDVTKVLLKVIPNLSTQKDATNFESKINALSAGNKTESEKSTQLTQIVNDYATNIQNNKLVVIVTIKTLSDTDKKELSNSINSLSQDAQKYTELAKKAYNQSKDLQKYTEQSDEQTKVLNEINNINTELKNKSDAVQKLTTTLKLFGKLGGLEK